MVVRLTVGKSKYAQAEAECWQVIEAGEALRSSLTEAVALDAAAFEGILMARKLPKETETQKQEIAYQRGNAASCTCTARNGATSFRSIEVGCAYGCYR